ncbi:MAG TPA: site-2 protease family protein [Solirubrobacteraceae bacterium]|jgi:Zn-dependent protease
MDSGDVSLHPPGPALPGAPLPAPASRSGENPFGEPPQRRAPARNLRKRIGSALAAVAALVAKFFAAIKGALLLLPKLKLLTTSATALVSVAAYSIFFGWPLAAGFVALLFVHEMGHVIALRREGIKASAPMFIPFLGAAIFSKSLGDNALAEARVGLAGPILGSLGAAAVALAGAITGSSLLLALAYIGFLINLFNLLPVVPLDGGRAMAAMAPSLWFIGFGALVALELWRPNPILLIIVIFGGLETWRRWKQRRSRTLEQAAYYRVSPRNRLIVGLVYLGLIVALVAGMEASYVHYASGHDFAHYF